MDEDVRRADSNGRLLGIKPPDKNPAVCLSKGGRPGFSAYSSARHRLRGRGGAPGRERPRQESAAYSPEAALLEGAASEAAPEQRNGVTVLSCEQIERLMSAWPAVSMLTFREADVLRALLANKKRKDIAADLNITEHTVKKHTANIFSKFHVSNRAELFAKAERETPAP